MSTIEITKGSLNLPGSSPDSKHTIESLLTKDLEDHHCFFNEKNFHNHLSHHLLAIYDLGATPEILKAVFETEGSYQRPILLDQAGIVNRGEITKANWNDKNYLGNLKAFAAYVHFFKQESQVLSLTELVEKFLFSDEATEANMLVRLIAGAVHPFIQLGYAAEFGNDPSLICSALAQTAIHELSYLSPELFTRSSPGGKLPLIHVITKLLTSPTFSAPGYEPGSRFEEKFKQTFFPPNQHRAAELARICSMWDLPSNPTDKDLERILKEAIWAVTTLFVGFFPTAADKSPQLDFFIMHAVTSSLFLRPLLTNLITKPESRSKLIHYWFIAIATLIVIQGLCGVTSKSSDLTIDLDKVMKFNGTPLPPNYATVLPNLDKEHAIIPTAGRTSNPWSILVNTTLHSRDSHVPKALRALLYGATQYGAAVRGSFPGLDYNSSESSSEDVEKVFPGISGVDGTLFIKAAGVMTDQLGWVDWGQPKGQWHF